MDVVPLAILGRERALLEALGEALSKVIGGPPPSRKTMDELHRHNSSKTWATRRGLAFEVQIVDPDDKRPTGHIVRVTVELDRFEAA
jgi:hypothetical protein